MRTVKRPSGTFETTRGVGHEVRARAALSLLEELSTCPPDVPAIMALVTNRVLDLTSASGAMIGVHDGGDLVVRTAAGTATALLGRREPVEQTLSGLVFSSGKPLICSDTAADLSIDPARFEGLGIRSLVIVPFLGADQSAGVVIVTSPRPGAFGGEDEQVLSVVCRALTSRLELVEQLRQCQLLLTENAIALATLRESENRFRSAFDNSGIGMALMALDGRWLKVNPALCRTLGYARHELLALDHEAATHPDDRLLEAPLLQRALAGELTHYEIEKRYVHKGGSLIWGLLTVSVVINSDRQAVYLIAQLQDITARKASEETLRSLAVRDDLTGVWNRREMFRLLNEETSRADRHCRPLSLIMLDVDAFKQVNDTYGHQAGDISLKQIARTIEDCVRSFDRVARYGGEEFAVILPETVGQDALAVAERIRARVAAQPFAIGEQNGVEVRIPLTVSSGIATMAGDQTMSVDEMIREADASLYIAKATGRNRCVAAPSALRDGRAATTPAEQPEVHAAVTAPTVT
jgi:diguanylate cyclase (GGDEF)-like protein/PAS domain S-box-containing protein